MDDIKSEDIFGENPEIELREIADGYAAFDPASDRLHFLNPTAAFLLRSCDGRLQLNKIEQIYTRFFELDQCPKDDILLCIQELLREGLIVRIISD